MARRKRVHYRPDAFQARGRRMAEAIQGRGAVIVAFAVMAVAAFVVAFVVLHAGSLAEENAATAFYYAGNDARKLERALAEYGPTSARPHMLLALGRTELERPTGPEGPAADEGDTPPGKTESPGERKARLARAEKALRELTEEHPDHRLCVYGLSLLGLALEEQGRYEEAADALKEALPKASEVLDPKIRYDIGRNYVLAGKPELVEKARPLLKRASEAGRMVSTGRGRAVAEWIENARHLKARIGPGERAVRFKKPAPEKKTGGGKADDAKADGEKLVDEGVEAGKPADEKGIDGERTDAEPADAEPADAEPADGEPADGERTDAKPADAEPADAEPADAKPVDEKAGGEGETCLPAGKASPPE